jgi:polar amino acid transport system ATP-binding protein
MVFQEYNIWSHMTVLENVMKPLILTKNIDEEKAKEIAI